MKALFGLFFALVFCSSVALQARNITVTKTNGGSGGYDRVQEHHESTGLFGWGEGKSTLDCNDPGSQSCYFQNMPSIVVQNGSNSGIDIANAQIAQGNLVGTYNDVLTTTTGPVLREISWNAANLFNGIIHIDFTPM